MPEPANPRDPTFDLHGYSTDTALEVATLRVREAWEHGCSTVTFVHGSAGVASRPAALDTGRRAPGAIKWLLRDALRDGSFAPYARRGRDAAHRLAPDSLTVALQACPDADSLLPWSATPPPEYGDSP